MAVFHIKEAAIQLGISPKTLSEWVRLQKFPHYKLGKRIVISDEQIQAFLHASVRGAVYRSAGEGDAA